MKSIYFYSGVLPINRFGCVMPNMTYPSFQEGDDYFLGASNVASFALP